MFKSIEYKLIIYLVLLILSVAGTTYFIIVNQIYYAMVSLLIITFSLLKLRQHYRKFNQNILFLLNAIDNGDYSFHFSETKISMREKELNSMLNRIKEILIKARNEVIENEQFLSIIVESVSTGIIILDDRNIVQAVNSAALQMLGLTTFTHLNQLSVIDETFPEIFASLTPQTNIRIKTVNERDEIQLSLNTSKISLKRGEMRVITLTNIGSELEAQEMESWIKLIRVMTHEIMNSIAPISSLSDTILDSYKEISTKPGKHSVLTQNTIEAFETINSTARGLLSFVESYRKFTGIPKPVFQEIEIYPLISNVLNLNSDIFKQKNITAEIIQDDKSLTINADSSQITQVLVNLIKNATEAIISNDKIRITAYKKDNKTHIDVANQGIPIPPDLVPNIFIPFFTTKESGSGIGLSVSRYIMRLHGGNLKYHATNGWTIFSMVF